MQYIINLLDTLIHSSVCSIQLHKKQMLVSSFPQVANYIFNRIDDWAQIHPPSAVSTGYALYFQGSLNSPTLEPLFLQKIDG